MTAQLVGEQEVEILAVIGPGQLAVRPLSFSDHYDRLQKQLQEAGRQLEKLSQPIVNQICVVRHENSWHRGLVEVIDRETCRVKFVDLGRRRNVNIDALRELPDHLLQEHAYCVLCHLYKQECTQLLLYTKTPPMPACAKVILSLISIF